MNKAIKNRKSIFVVTEVTNDAGWLLSRNVKAFVEKEAATYYANKLNECIEDDDRSYEVEELEMLEVVQ